MTDWSDIVRQHGSLVWRTAHRLLSNDSDASDCFQDTFVSALELSRRESIRSWPAVLKRLATARALERLRKRYRDAERNEAWPESPVLDSQAVDPRSNASVTELAQHLRSALTTIEARQAEVFCLVALEELSYREVADALNISVSHVGVLLHRAKQSLQEELEDHRPLKSSDVEEEK